MDSVHVDSHTTQLPAGFEGNFEISASSSDAEPRLKVGLKEQLISGESDASAFVNGDQKNEDPSSKIENGDAVPSASSAEEGPAPNHRTGGEAEAETEEEKEFDAEGYRVEERRETETLSHTEEITEKPERTELRTREIKEVTMEELKSRETTRPVSLEELKAILEAEFATTDEVEIGRDIVIEEFSRVESEHEEASGGRVTVATFSVKEERKTQEIKEQLQFTGAERNGFEEEPERRVDEVIETVEEVQKVEVPSSEAQAESFEGEVASKPEEQSVKLEEVAQQSEEVTQQSEEVTQTSEEVAQKSEEVAQQSEEVVQKSENAPNGTEEAAAVPNAEKEKVAEEHKAEKEKGSKSRGIINYIKVKARSLSRDRSHNRAAALSAAAAAATAEESEEPPREVSQSQDGAKSAAKGKTKQKKWKLFGRKSAGEQDDSSSEASASEEDITADKSEKRVKLVAFAKRSDEPKEEGDQVSNDVVAKTSPENVAKGEKKSTNEEGKQGRTKLGFIKMGKLKKEVDQKNAVDDAKPKATESEPEDATEAVKSISQNGHQPQETPAVEGKNSPEDLTTSQESKGEGQINKVTKEHKKFSFGSIFGKKGKKSQDKGENKSGKEVESPKTEEEKAETNDKVLEIAATEAHISVEDNEKADEEAVAASEQLSSNNIEEGGSSALTDEEHPTEVVVETSIEDAVIKDQVPELLIDQVDDVHQDEVEVGEIVSEKQVSESVEEKENLRVGQDIKTPAEDIQAGEVIIAEAVQASDVSEAVQQDETTDSDEKVVSVSAGDTEQASHDGLDSNASKQLDVQEKEDEAVQGKENEEVVEPVRECSAEPTVPEHINHDAQAPLQTTPEASTEAQKVGNDVEDASPKKDPKQTKKFSFGLKMGGQKKDGSKVEDDTQKPKVWSPFGKKPTKKEKEGQVTADAEKDAHVPAECKTPDPTDAEHAEDGVKVEVPEPKQSESREGTLKRNKGLHKLFSFGKKSKSADEKAGNSEGKAMAAETNGDLEPVAMEKAVDGGVSVEKGASEGPPEEEKHRHKKFSFGLKFGKKHDKEGGTPDGSKQQQTPTEDKAIGEGTQDLASPVPAGTEPKVEQSTCHTTQTEIEADASDPATEVETGEPKLSETAVVGVIVPDAYRIEVTGGSQEESTACQEVLTDEVKESAVSPIEFASPDVDVKVEKTEEEQTGTQEGSTKISGTIGTDEIILPTADIEVTVQTNETVETAKSILTNSSLESPTLELGGNEVFVQREDNAVVSENEDELIPRAEVKLLEESGVDIEADKPTLEFEEANKLVDDIMKSEISADAKVSECCLNGEINDLKINSPEVSVVVVTESATTAAPVDAEIPAKPETDAEELKTEHQSIAEKPRDLTEAVEPTETKAEGQSESAKEQKQKKHLFGIKFGKKTKQTASKDKIEEHEQNGVTKTEQANSVPVTRTESELSSEADKLDGQPEEKTKESQNIEGLIIEVEVVEEKEESKTEDAEDKPHHAGGIRWPHFGKKADKKKDEKENGEHVSRSDEVDTTVTAEADSVSKQPKGSTTKKPSHGLGKGLLKIFTPKKHLRFGDHSKTNGEADSQEPIVVYSIEGEGQVVAETHWRPKHESEPATLITKTSEQSPKGSPSEEHCTTANGKVSTDEANDKEAVPAILNGSAHDPEVPVVRVSQSACAEAPQPSGVTSPGHFVVVAIDFGTTFSGYAFSFINDPDSIHMMRKWEGGDPGVVNQKTPTTILLTPDGSFHSFGFTARDFYHDLDAAEAGRWMYFEKFKMTLHHNTELNEETTITSSNGKEFPAMRLFSYALRFFKDHALKELTSQSSVTIDNDDVRWVITVPAIWKAPAKQFMRQAAYQGGIASPSSPDRLLIALEPEAASIYIRKLRMSQLFPIRGATPSLHTTPPRRDTPSPAPHPHDELIVDNSLIALDSEHLSDHLKAGTRYMVVDCGGGTVDITVHELETDRGSLKELYKATGGPFGSTGVDQDFEKLLFEIFGSEFIETFKQKRPAGWVDLMIAFESRKRAANPHKDNHLNVSLPFSFIDFYKKQHGNQVDNAIKKFGGDKGVSWSLQGMLRLTPEAMQNLFQTTLDRITSAISDVLSDPTVEGIEYLFLVGGFSESPMLQHELRAAFDDKVRIIIPQDVSLTILKGAVCFGLDPTVITVRKSRMTYGVGVVNRFDPARHPDSKRIQKDGNDWCAGIFDTFVASGQPVTLGDKVIRRYAPANRDQKTSIIHVYCSESSDVQYVTDPGVQRCATMRLDLVDAEVEIGVEPSTTRREIEATMTFGDTEIRVSARDATTGCNVGSTIDFLQK